MTTINPSRVLMATKDPYCDHLASPNYWSLALSIFLFFGILISYLPQHIKIIRHQTSAGLSPWWVLLGTVSSTFAIATILCLPTSRHDMACCKEISGIACAAALMGVVQVGLQWICFSIIMILFLVFFPRQPLEHPEEDSHSPDVPSVRDALMVGVVSLVAILAVGITSTAFLVRAPNLLFSWANTLGIGATILSSIQYIPQLWTTWKLRHIFSLSIISMSIQVPGAFLFAFSLWLRAGWQGWSTWLVYIFTGILQGILLTMAIYFSNLDKEHGLDSTTGEPTEEDPLLPESSGDGDGDRNTDNSASRVM